MGWGMGWGGVMEWEVEFEVGILGRVGGGWSRWGKFSTCRCRQKKVTDIVLLLTVRIRGCQYSLRRIM